MRVIFGIKQKVPILPSGWSVRWNWSKKKPPAESGGCVMSGGDLIHTTPT